MFPKECSHGKFELQEELHLLKSGTIPPIEKNQKCTGCSLNDVCMPKIRKINSVREEIKKSVYEEEF